jgi:hypothetical protein
MPAVFDAAAPISISLPQCWQVCLLRVRLIVVDDWKLLILSPHKFVRIDAKSSAKLV